MSYQQKNLESIDKWCQEGWQWGIPISHDTYLDAINGKWKVYLTPEKTVPHEWLGDLKGKKSWVWLVVAVNKSPFSQL